ncbi:MAG: heme exporter protein CcmD [Albidovulum sp.]
MSVELGKYAFTVLAAYGVTAVLLVGLIGASVWQYRRVRRALTAQEQRCGENG